MASYSVMIIYDFVEGFSFLHSECCPKHCQAGLWFCSGTAFCIMLNLSFCGGIYICPFFSLFMGDVPCVSENVVGREKTSVNEQKYVWCSNPKASWSWEESQIETSFLYSIALNSCNTMLPARTVWNTLFSVVSFVVYLATIHQK